MSRKLVYSCLFLLLIGCEEDAETIDDKNINKEFEFVLDGDPINLSSNLNLSYFNDITVGVKEFRNDFVSLVTASNTLTVLISGNNIENLTDSEVLMSPPYPYSADLQ